MNCGLVLPLLANNTHLKYEDAHTSKKIRIPILRSQNLGIPPNNGAPKGSDNDTASRGQCVPESSPQALAPASGIGAAMTESATQLYFFIPQAISSGDQESIGEEQGIDEADPATFVLRNVSTGEPLYEQELEVAAPALLKLDFAQATLPIVFEAGQTYQWQFTLECDLTEIVLEYPRVSGLLRQIDLEPSLIEESKIIDLADRPFFYAERGLQYDAIAALIELIQTEPDNPEIAAIWQELLPEISLDVVKPALIQTLED